MNTNADMSGPVIMDTAFGPVEYAEYGHGPAVLCLHGAMGGYDQSLLLARTIGDNRYRYIGVSRPGYLDTPLTSGKSAEQQADLCAALLDKLGIDDALAMAVSGGGPCALNFALRHKACCRGLVLVSTTGQIVTTPIPFSFKLMGLMIRIPGFANAMAKKGLEDIDKAASRSITNSELRARTLQDPETGPLFKELLTSTMDRMPRRMPGTWNDIAITRSNSYALEDIAVPTLIIHGTEDPMVPFKDHAAVLASCIPGAELLALEGGEHPAIFTHRDEVKPRVAEFMSQYSPT